MQSGPRPFSWDRVTFRGHDDSFGETATRTRIGFVRGKLPAQSIDTFRNSAHHNGSMGSFGETDSGAIARFSTHLPRYHWVPLKIGADTTAIMQTRPRPFSSGGASHSDGHDCSFGEFGLQEELASFGESPSPGASTLFGTQHIITDQWVRLEKPIRGRSRLLSRPIPPIMPLASFGHTVVVASSFGETARRARIGFVRGKPPTRSITLFRNSTHQNWYWLRSGKPIQAEVARFLDPSCRDRHWLRFVIRSLASFGETSPRTQGYFLLVAWRDHGSIRGRIGWLGSVFGPRCARNRGPKRTPATPRSVPVREGNGPVHGPNWLRSGKRCVAGPWLAGTSSIGTNCQRAAHAKPQFHHRGTP